MRAVEVRIGVDHFRLYPKTELQPSLVAAVGNGFKTARQLFLVYEPVAETGTVAVASAEPAVVKHEGVDAESLDAVDGLKQTVTVKLEVHALPTVEHQRTGRVDPTRVDYVFAHEVMVAARHSAHALGAVAKHCLGRFKALARLELPVKALGVYTHRQARSERLIDLNALIVRAAVCKTRRKHLALLFSRTGTAQDDQRCMVMA